MQTIGLLGIHIIVSVMHSPPEGRRQYLFFVSPRNGNIRTLLHFIYFGEEVPQVNFHRGGREARVAHLLSIEYCFDSGKIE